MKNNSTFIKIIVGLVLLVISVSGYVAYAERSEVVSVAKKWDQISSVTVQNDCSLDIMLSNDDRIHGFLIKDIPPNSKKKLIVFFNGVEKPKCHKVEKRNSGWLVEIIAEKDGEDIRLIEYLGQNRSTWN